MFLLVVLNFHVLFCFVYCFLVPPILIILHHFFFLLCLFFLSFSYDIFILLLLSSSYCPAPSAYVPSSFVPCLNHYYYQYCCYCYFSFFWLISSTCSGCCVFCSHSWSFSFLLFSGHPPSAPVHTWQIKQWIQQLSHFISYLFLKETFPSNILVYVFILLWIWSVHKTCLFRFLKLLFPRWRGLLFPICCYLDGSLFG